MLSLGLHVRGVLFSSTLNTSENLRARACVCASVYNVYSHGLVRLGDMREVYVQCVCVCAGVPARERNAEMWACTRDFGLKEKRGCLKKQND